MPFVYLEINQYANVLLCIVFVLRVFEKLRMSKIDLDCEPISKFHLKKPFSISARSVFVYVCVCVWVY